MAVITDCPPCFWGNHEHHSRDHGTGTRPGVIGGAYCACKGDCAERAVKAYQQLIGRYSIQEPPPGANDEPDYDYPDPEEAGPDEYGREEDARLDQQLGPWPGGIA
jgi:hypothetical protein